MVLTHASYLLCSPHAWCWEKCLTQSLRNPTVAEKTRVEIFEASSRESLKMTRFRENWNWLDSFTAVRDESSETCPENSEQRDGKCATLSETALHFTSLKETDLSFCFSLNHKLQVSQGQRPPGQGTLPVCHVPYHRSWDPIGETIMILSKPHSWVYVASLSDFPPPSSLTPTWWRGGNPWKHEGSRSP